MAFLLGDVCRLDTAWPKCARKRRFATCLEAFAFRDVLYARYGHAQTFNVFWCDRCESWHLGRRPHPGT